MHREANSRVTENEWLEALDRRARRICKQAEIPTLNRAVTTAAELRAWLAARGDSKLVSLQALELEGFVHQSSSKVRVMTSLNGW